MLVREPQHQAGVFEGQGGQLVLMTLEKAQAGQPLPQDLGQLGPQSGRGLHLLMIEVADQSQQAGIIRGDRVDVPQ